MLFFLLRFRRPTHSFFFFFNDTATTEIYTLSLHDALPIFLAVSTWLRYLGLCGEELPFPQNGYRGDYVLPLAQDRKSTRLNSSHLVISYAVFCLKKKKKDYPPADIWDECFPVDPLYTVYFR